MPFKEPQPNISSKVTAQEFSKKYYPNKMNALGTWRLVFSIIPIAITLFNPASLILATTAGAIDIGANLGLDIKSVQLASEGQKDKRKESLGINLLINLVAVGLPLVSVMKKELRVLTAELKVSGSDLDQEVLLIFKSVVNDIERVSSESKSKLISSSDEEVKALLKGSKRKLRILTNKSLTKLKQLAEHTTNRRELKLIRDKTKELEELLGTIVINEGHASRNALSSLELKAAQKRKYQALINEESDLRYWTPEQIDSVTKRTSRRYVSTTKHVMTKEKQVTERVEQLWQGGKEKGYRNFDLRQKLRDYKDSRSGIFRNPIKFFGSEGGYHFTQNVQLFNPTDVGREIVNRPAKKLMHKIKLFRQRASQKISKTKWGQTLSQTRLGKSIFAASEISAEVFMKHAIPLYRSSWLNSVVAIKEDDRGMRNTLIVFFREYMSEPRVIDNVPRRQLVRFITAASNGSFYKKYFEMAPNQYAMSDYVMKKGLRGILPLAALKNIESVVGNWKEVISGQISGKGTLPFQKQFWQKTNETMKRNAWTRGGRVLGYAATGGSRLGAKFGTATARSLKQSTSQGKKTTFNQAFITSFRSSVIRNNNSKINKESRNRRLYGQNLRRVKGWVS